jgi:hypothetical protein
MDAIITVISTGMFAYWSMRTWLLLCGPEDEIEETLDNDLKLLLRLFA